MGFLSGPSISATQDPCQVVCFTLFRKKAKPPLLERKETEQRLVLRVNKNPLRLPSSFSSLTACGLPLLAGLPQKAKTNNSAKQGSIRPGSTVTLVSHLPGRGPNEPGGLPRSTLDLICITTASLSLGLVLPRCCNVSCLVLPVREVCISLMRTAQGQTVSRNPRQEEPGVCMCVHAPRRKCILILNRIIQ